MTTASTPRSQPEGSSTGRTWDRFRHWRRTRPFWGSVVAIIGGIEIYLAAAAPLAVVVMQGLPGLLTMAVFLITVILAGVTLYQPHLRSITGLLILLLGPLSIMATNLGGFVIGMILLVVGGGLILAWAPAEDSWDQEYISGDRGAGGGYTGVAEPGDARDAPSPGPDPHRPAHFASGSSGDTTVIDPIPSTGLRSWDTPIEASPASAFAGAEPRPQRDLSTGATVAPVTSRTKRPAPPPRSGLSGVLDTMFGARKSRKPAPGKRPGGQRGAGSRPAGGLPSLEAPREPGAANARTWVAIPAILLAVATSTALAGPARAAGPLDWLFPSAAPTPSATASATPTPSASASASSGTSSSSLTDLLNGTSSSSDTTAATDCPSSSDVGTTTSDKATAVQDCVNDVKANGQVTKQDTTDSAIKVPSDTSTLKASRMDVTGFKYDGVATVDAPTGPLKTLHFSASSVLIQGMDQTYPFAGGHQTQLQDTKSTATLKGNVELYVTSFKSNVFGLIPLTFTVDGLQPPLVLDSMFFTDATSVIAYVKCDQILIPDLALNIT